MVEALEYHLAGDQTSEDLVIFFQGWPDNMELWECLDYQISLKQHRLLFINFPNTRVTTHKWGMDFPPLLDSIKHTIDHIEGMDRIKRKILVAHDWGCFYAYYLDRMYPKYLSQLITMEIAPYVEVKGLWVFFMLFYQWYLIIAFLIGGKVGEFMTKKMVAWASYRPSYFHAITADRNYPYYYMWKNLLLKCVGLSTPYLGDYKPSVPVAYLYGSAKPFQFHGKQWSEYLSKHRENHCEIHQINAQHWLMEEQPKYITELLNRRIALKL